jgi:hypothetical protein
MKWICPIHAEPVHMQVEVWKMKDRVYEETKKMNSTEFFDYIKNKSKKLIAVNNKSVR